MKIRLHFPTMRNTCSQVRMVYKNFMITLEITMLKVA